MNIDVSTIFFQYRSCFAMSEIRNITRLNNTKIKIRREESDVNIIELNNIQEIELNIRKCIIDVIFYPLQSYTLEHYHEI